MYRLFISSVLAAFVVGGWAQKKNSVLSLSFELRYVTSDPKANGETDFKGATEWMTTPQRIEYLTHWQQYASHFFNDASLAEQVVTDDEVAYAMQRLKPQPLPSVRQKIVLDEWRWAAQATSATPTLAKETGNTTFSFSKQTWRFRLEMDIEGSGTVKLTDGATAVCEYKNDGRKHYAVFEVDLTKEERRYNLLLDGKKVVDFLPLLTKEGGVDGLVVSGSAASESSVVGGFSVDNIWGVGYTPTTDTKRLNQPMYAKTFIDVSSRKPVDTNGWQRTDYDDSGWDTCTMPKNHGTERHEGEALLLRRWVDAGDFEKAYFELESLFPSGELWINGKVVEVLPQETKTFKMRFRVDGLKLWSVGKPQLYQVRALLVNSISGKKTETFSAVDGDLGRSREMFIDKLTDDYVITTGFRTIEQDGGTFRINGRPELLRAPLYFGQRFPLEKDALDLLCPQSADIMKELLAVKKMNGNGMRMSAHWSDDNPQDGTNAPLFTEMADQLGLMFIWQTASWIRLRSPLVADFEGMATDVRQLRNAPSIVIWQPSNHPSLTDWKSAMTYWHKVYDAIYPNDTTRLITPTADFRHTRVYNDNGTRDNRRRPVSYCDPVWTANRISRGSMDYPTGFGQDWEYLRRWPVPHKWPGNADIVSFLNSPDRAYFNFEQEETIGQMNWSLFKGSPVYKYHSYEWDYDEGSIGRRLTCDEWRESQAWQAFSAYECIRKMRWLDYDGLSWCCMWGGANMGTYQKPLIDALGNKKLAFYAHRMGFQQVLAGSKDVDMVYGPADKPALTVLNLGEEQKADVVVTVRNVKGKKVYSQKFTGVTLPQGRTTTDLGTLKLPKMADGYYFFEYQANCK